MFHHWLKKAIVLICVLLFAGGGFFRSKLVTNSDWLMLHATIKGQD